MPGGAGGVPRAGLRPTAARGPHARGRAVCLQKCREHALRPRPLRARDQPRPHDHDAGLRRAPRTEPRARSPAALEPANRAFPCSPHPPQTPPERAHPLRTPGRNKEGPGRAPWARAVGAGPRKAGVCRGDVDTGARTGARALPRSPASGDGQGAGTGGPRGRGSTRGVTLARAGRGASPAHPKRAAPGGAGGRGAAREGPGGAGRSREAGARSAPGERRAPGAPRAGLSRVPLSPPAGLARSRRARARPAPRPPRARSHTAAPGEPRAPPRVGAARGPGRAGGQGRPRAARAPHALGDGGGTWRPSRTASRPARLPASPAAGGPGLAPGRGQGSAAGEPRDLFRSRGLSGEPECPSLSLNYIYGQKNCLGRYSGLAAGVWGGQVGGGGRPLKQQNAQPALPDLPLTASHADPKEALR